MFKLVVLSVLLAVAAAKPGYLHGDAHLVAPAVAVPSAVSYQSRTDVVSKPVVATYAAAVPVLATPVLQKIATPIVEEIIEPAVAAPAVGSYGYVAGPPASLYASPVAVPVISDVHGTPLAHSVYDW